MGFTELELRPGEKLLMSGAANRWQAVGSKGGKLFVTTQRIVFKAHALNFGSKIDAYELSEIETRGNTIHIATSSNLISFNIMFYTVRGEKLEFVVTRAQRDAWMRTIAEALTIYARTRIAMPSNTPVQEVNRVLGQIRAVPCEGCGAVVIAVSGQVCKCEYCGRPMVG